MATEHTYTSEEVGNLLDAQRLMFMQAMYDLGYPYEKIQAVLMEANNIVQKELTRRLNGMWEES